ncbi:glycoside hydrolase family 31 protein [Prolixibacteraceae bacterium JC049]|nr:glycoside hydrolase family 31 protein [Prolixibacteraceae bacterium JC049]
MKKIALILFALAVVANVVKAQNKIKLDKGVISIISNGKTIVQIDSICFNFQKPDNIEILSQNSDETKLMLDFEAVLGRSKPGTAKEKVELTVKTSNSTVRFQAKPKWARNIIICLKDLGGHYFGLRETLFPDNKKSPDLRGNAYDVDLLAEHGRYFENCASVFSAFYFNSLGYASFMDTFAYGRYELAMNGRTKIYHTTGTLDWYLFTGDYKQIYSSYYKVIGKPKYVPQWACGPIAWRDDHKQGAKDILNDAEQFTNLQIPLTAMFVDRPYSNGANAWSKMDFNDKFANPEQWIKTLNEQYDLQFMTWIAPATWGDHDFPGRLTGSFGYFDLTNPEAVTEWKKRLTNLQYKFGVKGHKMDRADEYFPTAEGWKDRTPMQQRRNKYGYLYSKVTDDILSAHWKDDNYNFARAAFHRAQPYLSAVWGGDVRTTWDGMASNLANALRCSFMGFPNWGTDVGGYFGQGMIPEDLFIRWLQFGAWTGCYEIKIDGAGGAKPDRAPWHCSEKLQKQFKKICEQRMEMLPYIYSNLNSSSANGAIMKPLAMVYPDDEQTYHIWNEYLFGDVFLVAPILSKENTREVYLPEGTWISLLDNKEFNGKQFISITADLTEVPVFVKKGSLFVKGNTTIGNQKNWNKSGESLDVYYYPEASNSSFTLIENGVEKSIEGESSQGGLSVNVPERHTSGHLYVYGNKKPRKVTVNGRKVRFQFNKTSNMVGIKLKSKQQEVKIFN